MSHFLRFCFMLLAGSIGGMAVGKMICDPQPLFAMPTLIRLGVILLHLNMLIKLFRDA